MLPCQEEFGRARGNVGSICWRELRQVDTHTHTPRPDPALGRAMQQKGHRTKQQLPWPWSSWQSCTQKHQSLCAGLGVQAPTSTTGSELQRTPC